MMQGCTFFGAGALLAFTAWACHQDDVLHCMPWGWMEFFVLVRPVCSKDWCVPRRWEAPCPHILMKEAFVLRPMALKPQLTAYEVCKTP